MIDFEKVLPVLLRRDMAEVGAHVAAFAVDFVTAHTLRLRVVRRNLFPVRRVAAV